MSSKKLFQSDKLDLCSNLNRKFIIIRQREDFTKSRLERIVFNLNTDSMYDSWFYDFTNLYLF